MQESTNNQTPLSMGRIFHTWWPLAASWVLMGAELPMLSAVVARLARPEINLAAYGGIVFPLSLIVEAPIIMLLAASTALCKDWDSFIKVRRFMMRTGALLTLLHVLVAFTPLYYVIVEGIIGAPAEIIEPARLGLRLMTPWAWSIGYRRFHQGVLIRFGYPRSVGTGTMIRLLSDATVLGTGYLMGLPGIVVATCAVSTGVLSEAIYAGLRARPVIRGPLRTAPPAQPLLHFRGFIAFYVPLAMTSLLALLVQPIGSMALSRMPMALESLAIWPVVTGLLFIFRSLGVAYNEVVVTLLDEPHSLVALRRFTHVLIALTTGLLVLIAATPLAGLWFSGITALTPPLAVLAGMGLWLGLPWPALNTLQSLYQGIMVHSRRTRGVTEAVAIFLVVIALLLWTGITWDRFAGLYIGLAAMSIGGVVQTVWLYVRSRPAVREILCREMSYTLAAAPCGSSAAVPAACSDETSSGC